jgi:hypothetical protein
MKKITEQIIIFCSLMLISSALAQTPEGTWRVSPVAQALAVGPNQGDTNWWSNSTADLSTRACLFDDTYVFNSDGSFENVLGNETWRESWQGVGEGCGAPVAPHDGSNAATWSYDSAANTITISGLGAYLGLAKVHNTGQDGAPVNNTIVYTVSSISNSEMTLDIDFGGGWWRYLMTKDSGEPVTETVFERLQGNVYRQVESVNDCGTCEDEINYYIFSSDGLRIIGTTLDGTCEQDDFTAFGDGSGGTANITENTAEEFTACTGSVVQLCQTITYLSETEIQFDFPFFSQTWTAQLYEDEVPCLDDTGGGGEPTSFDVTFNVDMTNETVAPEGVFVGGGFVGNANTYQMTDPDGDNIYSITINLPGTGGNYIFLNGPDNDSNWEAKENLAGQECADADNWNDRYLAPFTESISVTYCYGECTAECPVNLCEGVTGVPTIADDFDGNAVDILEYSGDSGVTYEIVDGAAFGATSNILQYVDNGGQYANLQLRTCNKFDLALTSVFTMDVYIDGSSLSGTQPNQVAFKLQNNDLDSPWTTQEEVVVQIDAVNTWQTVEFDFRTYTTVLERDDFDQVVIQFNSENNYDTVTAYIDNLQSSNESLGLGDVGISQFTYFPNPVKDHLTVRARTNIKDITVFNMLGQVVLRQSPNTKDGLVDMAVMQSGAYFVQISIGNTVETVRILKQ